MLVVLDACSIINLLTIDEDDFILGYLRGLNESHRLDIRICDKVYSEVKLNLKVKYPKLDFDAQLGELAKYTNVYHDFIDESESEITKCYEENLLQCFDYKKRNGEFYSVLCCSILSRNLKCKTYFYTDDFTAKSDFRHYFNSHQIGHIEDTADLLLFLTANNKDFRSVDLLRFLDNLRANYAGDYRDLYNKLNEHYDTYSVKDKAKRILISELITALNKHDIEAANRVKQKIQNKKITIIEELLSRYESVFKAKFEYVTKLDYLLKHFRAHSLFSIE